MTNPYAQPIDNLSAFTHPTYQQHFRYMNDREGVALTHTLLDNFKKTGYRNIVIIESGTSPMIQIMRRLPEFQDSGMDFLQIKIPRDQNFNLFEWFTTYLTQDELDETIELSSGKGHRIDLLRAACNDFDLATFVGDESYDIYASINDEKTYDLARVEQFHDILRGTRLSRMLSQSFLLFDEYINSGTVLRICNAMLRLVIAKPEFQVSAFCIFVDDSTKYPKIAFSLYDKRTELECYERGAYPYENRVDLIGYYYFVSPDHFQKVQLQSLATQFATDAGDPALFYTQVLAAIGSHGLADTLRSALEEPQVREYVSDNDVARHIILQLEIARGGIGIYSDLLDQVFEIYAPAWSPMPVRNHLDYWNGFATIKNEIQVVVSELATDYTLYRNTILRDVLQRLLVRNTEWNQLIETILEEEQS